MVYLLSSVGIFFLISNLQIILTFPSILLNPSSSQTTPLNFKIFGTNNNGYNGCLWSKQQEIDCHSWGMNFTLGETDYGNGIWNKTSLTGNKLVKEILKEMNFTSMRFPGGCGAHLYDWSEAVGIRKNFLYGIEEYLSICEEHSIEPIFTLSYFVGNNSDLMSLFRYLLSPTHNERQRNNPYNIKYFEFGNEVYHGDHYHTEIKMGIVNPIDYANRYLDLRQQLKLEFPKVELGLIIEADPYMMYDWNKKVLQVVGNNFDFLNPHMYPFHTEMDGISVQPKKIFKYALASSFQVFQLLNEYLFDIIKDHTKQIAVTEYNGGFVQENPVPYRYSYGNSLMNADLLINFLKISNRVIFANNWHLLNGYFGIVFNDDSTKYENWFFRPNYFSYLLIRKSVYSNILDVNITNYTEENFYSVDANDAEITSCCIGSKYQTTSQTFRKEQNPQKVKTFEYSSWVINDAGLPPQEEVSMIENVDEYIITFNDTNFDFFHFYSGNFSVDPNKRYSIVFTIKAEKFTSFTDPSFCGVLIDFDNGWTKWAYTSWRSCILSNTDDESGYYDVYFEFQPGNETKSVYVLWRKEIGGNKLTGKLTIKKKFIVKEMELYSPIPYLNVLTTINDEKTEIGVIILNKNLDKSQKIEISLPMDYYNGEIFETKELYHDHLDYVNTKDNSDELKISTTTEITKIPSENNTIVLDVKPHSLNSFKIHVKLIHSSNDTSGDVEGNSIWVVLGPIIGSIVGILCLLMVIIGIITILIIIFVVLRKSKTQIEEELKEEL